MHHHAFSVPLATQITPRGQMLPSTADNIPRKPPDSHPRPYTAAIDSTPPKQGKPKGITEMPRRHARLNLRQTVRMQEKATQRLSPRGQATDLEQTPRARAGTETTGATKVIQDGSHSYTFGMRVGLHQRGTAPSPANDSRNRGSPLEEGRASGRLDACLRNCMKEGSRQGRAADVATFKDRPDDGAADASGRGCDRRSRSCHTSPERRESGRESRNADRGPLTARNVSGSVSNLFEGPQGKERLSGVMRGKSGHGPSLETRKAMRSWRRGESTSQALDKHPHVPHRRSYAHASQIAELGPGLTQSASIPRGREPWRGYPDPVQSRIQELDENSPRPVDGGFVFKRRDDEDDGRCVDGVHDMPWFQNDIETVLLNLRASLQRGKGRSRAPMATPFIHIQTSVDLSNSEASRSRHQLGAARQGSNSKRNNGSRVAEEGTGEEEDSAQFLRCPSHLCYAQIGGNHVCPLRIAANSHDLEKWNEEIENTGLSPSPKGLATSAGGMDRLDRSPSVLSEEHVLTAMENRLLHMAVSDTAMGYGVPPREATFNSHPISVGSSLSTSPVSTPRRPLLFECNVEQRFATKLHRPSSPNLNASILEKIGNVQRGACTAHNPGLVWCGGAQGARKAPSDAVSGLLPDEAMWELQGSASEVEEACGWLDVPVSVALDELASFLDIHEYLLALDPFEGA